MFLSIPSNLMKLIYLSLLAALLTPSTFGAKAVVTYRNNEYDVIGTKKGNVVIRVNDRPKSLKPDKIRILDDTGNQLHGTIIELSNLLVTLKQKGTRALIVEADLKPSDTLTDCFLILVSGSRNDVNTVVRTLPKLPANQSSRISFTIKTNEFTKSDPYKLCLFSEGKSIVFSDGEDIVENRITPYEQMPRVLFQVDSQFPEELKSRFSQAKVLMEFSIDENGNATDAKALESPHKLFTENAIVSLTRSKFLSRYTKGVAKPSRIRQVILFRNKAESKNDAQ